MKKMFIAVAIVCMAAFTQAGTVKWGTVSMYGDAEAKVGSNATLYIYALANQAAFDNLTDIWGTYGDDIMNNSGSGAVNPSGKKTSMSKATVRYPDGTASANTEYYVAAIVTIGSGADMKYYAEKATALTGDDGNADVTIGAALSTAASAKTAWQPAAVPEPTSGLLLLIGASLLALRRKQK